VAQGQCTVHGQVIGLDGRGVPQASVVAIDRDLRSEQELGRTVTDAGGNYSIGYVEASYSAADQGAADLVVRVLDADGSTLAESPIRFNAGRDELVTVVVEDAQTEYERLARTVEPERDGVAVVDLTAADIAFLASDLGWEQRLLRIFVLAAQLTAQTLSTGDKTQAVPAEFFYATLRGGLPADLTALSRQPPALLAQVIRDAVEALIVPAWVADQAAELQARLARRFVAALATPNPAGPALGQVLAVIADDKVRLELTQLWYQAEPAEFWKQAAGSGVAERLQAALTASTIVGADTALLTGVLDRLDGSDVASLAEWDESAWGALVDQAGGTIPPEVGNGDPQLARNRYLAALATGAADAFPRRALLHRLGTSELPGAGDLANFLAERVDIELDTLDVRALAAELPAEQQPLVANLAALLRLYRLSPRFEHIEPLFAAGLTSASLIARMSGSRFVERFATQLGERPAAALHRRAVQTYSQVLAHLLRFRRELDAGLPTALAGSPVPGDVPASWSALFGSVENCECPDCRSALSPSAYLVDLLQFLANRSAGSRDALAELRRRRPDIEQLELSCANTTTTLPQLDLAIELCESRLGAGDVPVATDRPAAELAVQPEVLPHSDEVYRTLRTRFHPWPLPFDRPWEETRLHLARLGTPREAVLLALLRPDAEGTPVAIAAERLGIPPVEIGAVTGTILGTGGPTDESTAQALWGLGDDWLAELRNVRTALARTGLTFPELAILLETDFVRAHGGPTLTGAGCDLAGWSITDLNPQRLTALQAFLRVSRRSGWTTSQLDDLLTALGATDLDSDVLVRLGQLSRLQQRLALPIEALTWWWGPLPTAERPGGRPSPWQAVFLDPVRVGRPDPALLLRPDGSGEPVAGGDRIAAHAEAVRAALGLTGVELAALLRAAPTAQLSRTQLSALYREVSLARALGMPLTELLSLRRLQGIDILATQQPAAVSELVERWEAVQRWGWSATELATLLTGDRPAGSPSLLDDSVAAALQRSLGAARQASQLPVSLDADTLDVVLRRLTSADRVEPLAGYFQPAAKADDEANRRELAGLLPQLPTQRYPDVLGASAAAEPAARLRQVLATCAVTDPLLDQLAVQPPGSVEDGQLSRSLQQIAPKSATTRLAAFFAAAPLDDTPANRRTVLELVPELLPGPDFWPRLLGPTAGSAGLRLATLLHRVLSVRAVVTALASATGTDSALVGGLAALLRLGAGGRPVLDVLTGDALALARAAAVNTLDPDDIAEVRAALDLVAQAVQVARRLQLGSADLSLVCGAGPTDWLDLSELPVLAPAMPALDAFGRVADFFTRRARRQRPGADWTELLRAALDNPTTATLLPAVATALAPSAAQLAATRGDLDALVGEAAWALGTDDPSAPGIAARRLAWQDGTALCRLDAALEILATIGTHAATALSWVSDELTGPASAAAVQALRARYPDDQWAAVARPLRDLLRARQRDALVAAVSPPANTTDDLSADLLIDVSIEPCLDTSRIEAAIGSVQTFVQRCLLGLEDGIRLDAEAADEWHRWMHSYRLWEANRRIFLYPENYLHPELREDRTPFFDELEQQLNQGQLDGDRIESLYTHYLEQLDIVARLEVCGCYHEQGVDRAGLAVDRLHVVGRTASTPHGYWYRHLDGVQSGAGGRWSAWEKLPLDIDAEQVVLTVVDGRLFLCWPEFENRSDPQPPPPAPVLTVRNVNDAVPPPDKVGTPPPPAPLEHLDLKLAYSRRSSTGWQAKRVTDPLEIPHQPRALHDACTRFWTWLVGIGPKILGLDPTAQPPDRQLKALIDGLQRNPAGSLNVPQSVLFEVADPSEVRLVVSTAVTGPAAPARPQDAVDLRVQIFLRDRQNPDIGLAVGEGALGGCHGAPTVTSYSGNRRPALLAPAWTALSAPGADSSDVRDEGNFLLSALRLTAPFPDSVDVATAAGELYPIRDEVLLLDGPAGPFRLTLPSAGEYRFDDVFFCAGPDRTFVVRPVEEPVPGPALPVPGDPGVARSQPIPLGVRAAAWRATSDDLIARIEQSAAGNPAPLDVNMLRALAQDRILPAKAGQGANTKDGKNGSPAALFVDSGASALVWNALPSYLPRTRKYRFELFQHPYICRFLIAVRRDGLTALLRRSQQAPDSPAELNFADQYVPSPMIALPYPQDGVDFARGGAYATYNWELFVHAPLLIAQRLRQDQRFEDSLRWHQRIFDPTSTGAEPLPARYWNVQPFYDAATGNPVDELRMLLAGDPSGVGSLAQLVADWRANPFQPWRVAELRRLAVPKAVVMSYLDLLLAWGDARFREYRRETVREASLLYLWAAQILGPKPQRLPEQDPPTRTYATLRAELDGFANAVVAVEELLPASPAGAAGTADAAALRALESVFYFCIPANDRLQRYWTDIEDRLFKIRHCQDIDGVARPMALFDPPIDPDLLVRAAAAGVDLDTVGAYAPAGPYRFQVAVAKALELTAEVRALGTALLGALERRDGEQLARLRSGQELIMLDALREVRQKQLAEAQQSRLALQRSQDIATARRQHYQDLIAAGQTPGETQQLQLLEAAARLNVPQAELETLATTLQLIPEFSMGVEGFGGSPSATMSFGGSKIAGAVTGQARVLALTGQLLAALGGMSGIRAGYDRRLQEWQHQLDLAGREIGQLTAQLAAADVRVAIAQAGLDNHDLQARQAREMDAAMRSKFTSQELYGWLAEQVSGSYFAGYTLALEAARRAEQVYRYEHPERDDTFISTGGWDSLHQGLHAGDRLHAELRRMEDAWLNSNQREFELTKQISLALLAPDRLVELRATGRCDISLPEGLFDADHPGHYLRRLRSVSLTVPAVVGPYSSVNCELTLTSSRVRVDPTAALPYPQPADSTRFRSYSAAASAIATSRGHSDAGLFELSFRDERYLPFEGAGAISEWELRMDPECNDFDLQSVTDVILEISYTARDGGSELRTAARDAMIAARNRDPQYRFFSARTDFADAWYQFLHPITDAAGQTLELALDPARFPYRARQATSSPRVLHLALVLSEEGRAAYPTSPDGSLGIVVQDGSNTVVSADDDHADGIVRLSRTDASAMVLPTPPLELTLPEHSTLGTWRITVPQPVLDQLPDALVVVPPGQPKRLRSTALADLLIVLAVLPG